MQVILHCKLATFNLSWSLELFVMTVFTNAVLGRRSHMWPLKCSCHNSHSTRVGSTAGLQTDSARGEQPKGGPQAQAKQRVLPLVSLQPVALHWVAHLWLNQFAALQHPGTSIAEYKAWRTQAAALTVSCSVEVVSVDGRASICQGLAGIGSSLQKTADGHHTRSKRSGLGMQ
jgi:hypothetical protein